MSRPHDHIEPRRTHGQPAFRHVAPRHRRRPSRADRGCASPTSPSGCGSESPTSSTIGASGLTRASSPNTHRRSSTSTTGSTTPASGCLTSGSTTESSFIQDALADPEAKVLVHCHMGINRGPSLAFAALLASGWDPVDAIDRIRQVRPIAAVGYAEDALAWHHRRAGTPASIRVDERRRLRQWRRTTGSTSCGSSATSAWHRPAEPTTHTHTPDKEQSDANHHRPS